ncbi:nucleolar protein,Nop52-domain-containing protein [Melampsora americana]|nr:nucleolar protein,Nop52-domain-containing protein [Melampsora americana]
MKETNENQLKRKSNESSISKKENSKRNKTKKSKVQVSLKGDTIPLGKFLASNDKSTRDRAVAALRTFISNSDKSSNDLFSIIEFDNEDWNSHTSILDPRLDTLSMSKLYKGLFYCYWMSDKPLVQQQLANELSELPLVYRPNPLGSSKAFNQIQITKGGLRFWKAFWVAIRLEWHGIDRHRIDKYLLLCRRFLGSGLRLLQRVDWNQKAIEEWSEILKETVLNVSDPTNPMSLAYHFCDIFLEELHKTLQPSSLSNKSESESEIEIEIKPLIHSLDKAYIPSSSTITIFDSFSNKLCLSNQTSSIDLKLIRSQVLKTIFETGAQKDCLEVNRKKLYTFWASKGGTNEDED